MDYHYLGELVRTSQHRDACTYMIKRIDTENERVYLAPMDQSFSGQWYSGNALYPAKG